MMRGDETIVPSGNRHGYEGVIAEPARFDCVLFREARTEIDLYYRPTSPGVNVLFGATLH